MNDIIHILLTDTYTKLQGKIIEKIIDRNIKWQINPTIPQKWANY